MTRSLPQVWNEWGIQILVLLSFAWQVLLLVSAGIRRRGPPAPLRLLLWLMYLLADSTAIYALGHLSFTSKSQEHKLVAFWAPFLLVHLGGPDNITAYSLEDNRLWLRHLFTLSVQVMGAAFVIYKYVVGTGTLLLIASTLMFAVGMLKYGERTWALKCGNMDSIRSTVDKSMDDDYRSAFSAGLRFPFPDGSHDHTDEEFLLVAHSLFHMCKSLFADLSIMLSGFKLCSVGVHTKESKSDLYKLVELELSLMYDILYTKAAVIHTWYGCCIRLVSLLGTVAAVLLFQFSDKLGYSVADVVITYVLLVGALVLEIISSLKAAGSTWTCAMLYCMGSGWLLDVLKSLRRYARAASKRGWSGSIGQFSMFHLCTRDITELGSRVVAPWIWLEDKWNKMHFAGTTILTPDLKELLLDKLPKMDVRESRGIQILETRKFDKDLAEWSHWSVTTSFDESILVWHIATVVYLCESKRKRDAAAERAEAEQVRKDAEAAQAKKDVETAQGKKDAETAQATEEAIAEKARKDAEAEKEKKDAEAEKERKEAEAEKARKEAIKHAAAIQVLSNYMMFLLVSKPEMLPGPIRQSQYVHSCNILDQLWSQGSTNQAETKLTQPSSENPPVGSTSQAESGVTQPCENPLVVLKKWFRRAWEGVKKLFCQDGPSGSITPQIQMLSRKMLRTFRDITAGENLATQVKSLGTPIDGAACIYGLTLAEELLRIESTKPDLLEAMFEVWVQMLCYAAHHCSRDAHARQLNSGGEFITVVWLLTQHILMHPQLARQSKKQSVANPGGVVADIV